jgi:Domain of unknown function (DUF6438)
MATLRKPKIMKTTFRFRPLIFVFVLGLAASACAPPSSLTLESEVSPVTETPYADLVIILERTACFGTCPVYKLTIAANGTVIYEGHDFVEVEGKQTASLGAVQIQELVSAFERANFFSLQDNYTNYDVTDNPSAITSITLNGKTKTVNHYYGDNSAPQELFDLESKIDEIVNSKQWTGK